MPYRLQFLCCKINIYHNLCFPSPLITFHLPILQFFNISISNYFNFPIFLSFHFSILLLPVSPPFPFGVSVPRETREICRRPTDRREVNEGGVKTIEVGVRLLFNLPFHLPRCSVTHHAQAFTFLNYVHSLSIFIQ